MSKVPDTVRASRLAPAERPAYGAHRRMTRQRRIILRCLRANPTHPTADELYLKVRGLLPHVSLGTVYRNLEVLCSQGEVVRLAGPQMRFDGNTRRHYHVRCEACGRVADIELSCPDLLKAVRGAGDFELLDQHLEFVGRCGRCRKIKPGR